MIVGLKSEFEDMEISILTGYRDFDYAREAIRLGVTRFMLKPSKEELRMLRIFPGYLNARRGCLRMRIGIRSAGDC